MEIAKLQDIKDHFNGSSFTTKQFADIVNESQEHKIKTSVFKEFLCVGEMLGIVETVQAYSNQYTWRFK